MIQSTNGAGGCIALLLAVSTLPVTAQTRVHVVLQEGDTPAGGGGPVVLLNAPRADSSGRVGFSGVLDQGGGRPDPFLWIGSEIAWLASASQPQYGFTNVRRDVAFESRFGAPSFAVIALVAGGFHLVTEHGVILSTGAAAPGQPGYTFDNFVQVELTSSGTLLWTAEARDASNQELESLFASSLRGRILDLVLGSGQTIDGLEIDQESGLTDTFDVSPAGNHHGHLLWVNDIDPYGPVSALYVDGKIRLRSGEQAGGLPPHVVWTRFVDVVIDDRGDYAFHATIGGVFPSTRDTVLGVNGNAIVREGDTVAGVVLSAQGHPRSFALAGDERLVFTWITNSFGPEYMIYTPSWRNVSAAQVVLRAPSAVDTDGDGVADTTVTRFGSPLETTFGAGNEIYTLVELDHGSGIRRDAIIRVDHP